MNEEEGKARPEGYERERRKAEARVERLKEELAWLEGKAGPFLLEIGCGHGHWLTSFAESHPGTCCMGIDLKSKRIERGWAKAEKRGLANLHFWKAEAREFLEATPKGTCWNEICFLFLDPWPKERHHKRRLLQRPFLDLLAKKSSLDGHLYFRTDYEPFFRWTAEQLKAHPEWKLGEDLPWIHEHGSYFQDASKTWKSLVAVRQSN